MKHYGLNKGSRAGIANLASQTFNRCEIKTLALFSIHQSCLAKHLNFAVTSSVRRVIKHAESDQISLSGEATESVNLGIKILAIF